MVYHDEDNEWARYEPTPSLLAGGEQYDLDREAQRLCLIARAYQSRAAAAARRAEGWRSADEAIADAESQWLDRVSGKEPRGVDFRDFTASASEWRMRAEARREQMRRPRLGLGLC